MMIKSKRYKYLALVVALFLVVQMLPMSVLAECVGTTSSNTTQDTAGDVPPQTDWEGTGELNPDGTPVTAEQGDTPA